MIYFAGSADAPRGVWTNPKLSTAKFLDGMIDPERLPVWLTEEDLNYYVEQYRESGFRGPLNWYRNIDRNIQMTPQLETAKIERPSFFIAGAKDLVLSFVPGWIDQMDNWVTDMRGKVLIDAAAHWVQVEQAQAVNEALLGFLKTVS
jgi:epoxide hydrolase A/B